MLIKKAVRNRINSLILIILTSTTLLAQKDMPLPFQERIQVMQLDIAVPVENTYKQKRPRRNDFFQANYVLRSKRSKVEIHYSLIPTENADQLVPQVSYATTLANMARNEEAYGDIAVHRIPTAALEEQFNADWGSIAYFHPKTEIGRYQHAKLLALYKEHRGMVYVLFLFDQRNEETVESLSQAVRFTSLYQAD